MILMRNLLPTDVRLIGKFDIKGSKLDRRVSKGGFDLNV